MATTQEIMSAMSAVQRNAQQGLPVIPNNGNPQGVYNMPADQMRPPLPATQNKGPDLSWLQPSQHMAMIQAMLSQQQQNLQSQQVSPQVQTPAAPATTMPQQPVLPAQATNTPILPQRTV